jgi:hypothetical protein
MPDFRPGDVVEIDLGHFHAHLQLTHLHPSYPPVVRALCGRATAPWPGPEAAAETATAFVALVPLASVLARSGRPVRPLGAAEIPEADRAFPSFRVPVRGRDGGVLYWWLWDGSGLTVDDPPSPGAASLPIRRITGTAELLERLEREL